MKSCLALDEDNKMVKFYINERIIDFTNEEFEELTNLYKEMISTSYFGNVFSIYRDDQNKLHRLCIK